MRIFFLSLLCVFTFSAFIATAHAEQSQLIAKKDSSFWSTMFQKEKEEAMVETPVSDVVITVTAPDASGKYQTAKTYIVVWGDIEKAEKVTSIRVNDYVLKKYKAGDKKFSYIASTKMKTLKRGENVYTIEALDAEGKVLSTAKYTIISDVKFTSLAHTGANTYLLALLFAGAGAWVIQRRIIF